MTTLLRRLLALAVLKLLESGCQVRRRHASSAFDDESRRENIDEVGDARTLLAGEYAAGFDVLPGPRPKSVRPRLPPWGDWKGFPLEGTLRRRPGVLFPAYML